MSKRMSIHIDKTTAEGSEEQVIRSAQQELDLISEFATQDPFQNLKELISENLPSTLEEEDILSTSPISPILSEHFPSDRENSGDFPLGDEKLVEIKKLNIKPKKKPPVKTNSAAQIVPQYKEAVRHHSLRPDEYSDKPPSVIPEVPAIKGISADKETPLATQETPHIIGGTKKTHSGVRTPSSSTTITELPQNTHSGVRTPSSSTTITELPQNILVVKEVSPETPCIIEKQKKTRSGVRTSSEVSSTMTITELPQNVNSSSTIENSSTADQVIMVDEQPKQRDTGKSKSSGLAGLLFFLLCSCCCSRCRKIHQRRKKNEQSLPTSNPPKTEVKTINKRRRNYCICCLILILIIIILLLLGVILLVDRGKSPASNNNNSTVTNTSGNPNISQNAAFCLSTFNALVPSLAKNFSCDTCGIDDTFYNITEFCVLKGIWANTPNKTALESQGWLQSKEFCKWSGVVCDNSGNIIAINLNNPGVPNIITDDIGRLNTLQNLTIIGLVQQPFGKFPVGIFKLNKLQLLNIQFSNFTSLPDSFDKLTSLKILTLARNPNLGTSLPKTIGSSSLTSLTISGQGLTGNIPDFIVNSKSLQSSLNLLDLSANSLTGSIPSSLSQFNSLITLDLELNNLTSQIPDFSTYASAKSMRNLQLGANGLTGQIPTSISALQNLQVLQLQRNRLSGNIPSQIGSMNNLQQLDLSHNGLTGSIPDSVAALNVPQIDLSSNSLSGTIPSKMCQNNYTKCNLSSNNLTISGSCGVCLT